MTKCGFPLWAPGLGAVLLTLGSPVCAQECGPAWIPAFPVDPALYPFTHRCLDLDPGTLHYMDEGPRGEPAGVALMIHGNPTWSFLYRDVARTLLPDGWRVIAPDLFGFGLSDKPDPAVYPYSPRAHSDALQQFVETLDLRDVVLVVHDWGGPIGLHMGGGMAERFSSVVILNSWAWTMSSQRQPWFHDAIHWSRTQVQRAGTLLRTGVLPRRVGETLGALHGPPGSAPYGAVRDAYWAPFLDLETGRPLSEGAMQPTNRPYHFLGEDPEFMEEVMTRVEGLSDHPLYLVTGSRDPLFGVLRCDELASPPCPPGSSCRDFRGVRVCRDDASDRLFFPSIDEFRARWNEDQIVGVLRSPDGEHFVQEYEAEAIAEAIRAVHGVGVGRLRETREVFSSPRP